MPQILLDMMSRYISVERGRCLSTVYEWRPCRTMNHVLSVRANVEFCNKNRWVMLLCGSSHEDNVLAFFECFLLQEKRTVICGAWDRFEKGHLPPQISGSRSEKWHYGRHLGTPKNKMVYPGGHNFQPLLWVQTVRSWPLYTNRFQGSSV